MKKMLSIAMAACLLFLAGCGSGAAINAEEHSNAKFDAQILEMNGDTVLVLALDGEDIRRSSDKITFSKKELEDIGAQVGDIVTVIPGRDHGELSRASRCHKLESS